MNKKLARALYLILGVVTAVLLILTLVASFGKTTVWKGAFAVIALSALGLALAISAVAYNPKKTVYSVGFYVLHIGIVAFLVGIMGYALGGTETYAAPANVGSVTNVMEYRMYQMGYTDRQISSLKGYNNRIGTDEGDVIDLGFNFRITDFQTEYYENGAVKHYEATVEFLNSEDGSTEQVPLTVNHPIYRNGWKIYLMDVGTDPVWGYQKVQLMFKQDPTEFLSVTGIILTVIGTFLMCMIRPRIKQGAPPLTPKKGGRRK